MKTCDECDRKFPDELVQPLITSVGSSWSCPICALEITNNIHHAKRTKFDGKVAEKLRQQALAYISNR